MIHHSNRIKDKPHQIITARKGTWQLRKPFTQTLGKPEMEGNVLNWREVIREKAGYTALENRSRAPPSAHTTYTQRVTGGSSPGDETAVRDTGHLDDPEDWSPSTENGKRLTATGSSEQIQESSGLRGQGQVQWHFSSEAVRLGKRGGSGDDSFSKDARFRMAVHRSKEPYTENYKCFS